MAILDALQHILQSHVVVVFERGGKAFMFAPLLQQQLYISRSVSLH